MSTNHMDTDLSRLSDMMHKINNLSMDVASFREVCGYRSVELEKLRIAKRLFCVLLAASAIVTICEAYLLGISGHAPKLGFVLFIRMPIMLSVLVMGWWMSCRAIQKEKTLIGHNLS